MRHVDRLWHRLIGDYNVANNASYRVYRYPRDRLDRLKHVNYVAHKLDKRHSLPLAVQAAYPVQDST